MRKTIAILGLAGALVGAFWLLQGAGTAPNTRTKAASQSAAQAVRKSAAKNPTDALLQAQTHVAGAYRAALARDAQATSRQLAATMADLQAARPGVARQHKGSGSALVALEADLAKLRGRVGNLKDEAATAALVQDLAATFKRVKDLQARYETATGQARAPKKTAQ